MSAVSVEIALTGEQAAAMQAALDAGEYGSTAEIIQAALQQWQWMRELQSVPLKKIRELWDEGEASGPATALDANSTREEARLALKKTIAC